MAKVNISDLDKLQSELSRQGRIFFKTSYGVGELEEVTKLSKMYMEFEQQVASVDKGILNEVVVKLSDVAEDTRSDLGYRGKLFSILSSEFSRLVSLGVVSFIVHGSFATDDWIVGWSDLDAMVVLSKDVCRDAKALVVLKRKIHNLARICYLFDPLAHHEFFIISELELGYYPETYLPIASWREARALAGRSEFSLNIRNDQTERTEALRKFYDFFEARLRMGGHVNNIDLKDDLSHILLLPAIILQNRNFNLYKRESFSKIKEVFPSYNFSFLDHTSNLRFSWRTDNMLKYLPGWVAVSLPNTIWRITLKLGRTMAQVRPAVEISNNRWRECINSAIDFIDASKER